MPKYRARVDRNQGELIDALEQQGWLVVNMSRVGRGFPDTLLVKGGRIVLAEIKDGQKSASRRKLTDAQEDFHARMKAHGVYIEVLTDLDSLAVLGRPMRAGDWT